MSRARQQFAQLDQAISKDAMSRLRGSPQGSVLGALNALFSPHPVTGAPTAQQAASQGLLGKMVSSPGGGGPPLPGDSRISGSAQNGTTLGSVLEQAANVTTTDKVKPVLTGPQPGDVNTTDTIKQNLTGTGAQDVTTTDQIKQALIGQGPQDVTTTDTIKQVTEGKAPGDTTTTDTVKEKLDPESAAKTESDSGASGNRAGTSWAAMFASQLKGLFPKSAADDLKKSAGGAGNDAGSALDKGLIGGVGPGILGISAKISGITAGVGAALGAVPALAGIAGTGAGVALIGGIVGVVSKGAIAAVQPAVTAFQALQNAAPGPAQVTALKAYQQQLALLTPAQKSLATSLEGMQGAWANFVKSNTAGVATIIGGGIGLLPGILASMSGVFQAVVPQMASVFRSLGGVVQGVLGVAKTAVPAFAPFVNAILGLVTNILPGVDVVIKATIPFISQFAGVLGNLGRDLGSLFATAAPAIGASMQILSGLLGLVGDLLPVVAKLADIFAVSLAPVFLDFAGVIKELLPPLTLVGSVIASFAGAVIGDLASAFGAIATLIGALAPSLGTLATTLSGVFTVLENTGVFAVFGDALENLAVPLAGLINALVAGLAPVLPVLTAAFSQLITDSIDVLSVSLGAVLGALTPVVAVLAQAVTAVVGFLQSTGLLLPVMAGLALTFGPVASGLKAMAAGAVLFAESGMAGVIGGMVGSLKEFALATEGVTLAQKGQLAGMLALDAVNPLGWAVIAGVAVAGLVVGLNELAKGSHDLVDQLTAQDNATGYNISGYQKLAGQLTTVSASFTAMAQSSGNAVKGQGGQLGQVAQQYGATATAMQALAVNMQGRLTTLSDSFGVSQAQIEKWATAAGISAAKFAGAGANVGSLTQQIVGYVNKNAAAITATASLGTNMAIFGNDVFSTTTQLDAFNGIWNTLVGNLLTKQTAVTSSNTAFDNLTQTIKSSGANSDTAKQSFQQYIAQIGSSASTLEKQGASVSTVNGYLQGQIDHIKTLGPLNASEKADLQGLTAFQDALANSTNGLNAQQKALISQFEAHLIPDLVSMHANTPKVTGDISNLANSIIQTGNGSASTAGDRAKLIADLKQAGATSQQAATFVNQLQGQINSLKGKVVQVGVNATAQGTLNAIAHLPGASPTSSALVFTGAEGGFVTGGTPGKDSVLAMLMPGEVVVPTAMVQAGAVDFLKGSIPGFAAGGMVNLDGPGQWAAVNEGSWGQKTAAAWANAVKNAFEASAAKAATAAAAQFVATQGASGGIIQSLMKNMAAARGWTGAEWNALAAVETREAGFCLTINHMILTRHGWLKHDEVVPGDETIGYNPETGKSEWTHVTAVHHYEDQPVVTYGNKYWQATFTPGHRWLTETRLSQTTRAPLAVCPVCGFEGKSAKLGIRNHMVRSHGWKKFAPRNEETWQEPRLTPWNEFTGRERVILSRPADTGPGLPITDREAALLGWIAGDGCIMENRPVQKKVRPAPPANWRERTDDAPFGLRRDGTPRKSAGGRPYKDLDRTSAPGTSGLSVTIAQSKMEHFAAIEDALTGIAGVGRYTQDTRGRTPGTGFGVTNLVSHRWRLPAAYAYDLLARAGHPKKDAFEQVTQMSSSQRHAWLEAMIAAEGTVHVPEPGKPKDGRKTVIYQNDGPIADAIELAVYLEGYRPGRNRLGKAREVAIRPTVPHVGGPQRLSFSEDAGTADVWCVTTELGSWTTCNESGMFLTGNSMTATNPSSGAYGLAQFINGPSEYAQYGGNSTTAMGQITGMLNYIAQRYGDPIAAENHEVAFGWYGNGGVISEPVIGYGVNSGRGYVLGERGSEMVTPIGGTRDSSGPTTADVVNRLDKLIRATEQVPAGVGAHVGGVINGASHDASFRSRYPR